MPHTHFTREERYQLTHLKMAELTIAEIARRLGRHRGTIARELKRNSDRNGHYHYTDAQRQAQHRRTKASTHYKLDDVDSMLGQVVRAGLAQRWSPEQIADQLKRDHPDDAKAWISHKAIYQWVCREAQRGEVYYARLRRGCKRRRFRIPFERKGKRGQIVGRVGIESHPTEVDERRRVGHWESDTIEGAKGSGLAVTHVERKSRLTRLAKGSDFSQVTNKQLAEIERSLNNRPRKCLNYRTPLEAVNALPGVALRN